MKAINATELLRVLQFGDSTLPVGAFSFSNSLESALQAGEVRDADTLGQYVRAACRQTSGLDGVALLAAHRAASRQDLDGVLAADEALMLRRVGEEQQLMTTRMGKKLGELAMRLCPAPLTGEWVKAINDNITPGCFPVGMGLLFAGLELPERDAFAVHHYGLASMMVGAALRMMRVDHYDTQSILFAINGEVEDEYLRVAGFGLGDMAGFAPVFDVMVAHHVESHVRMFMN